LNVNKLENEWFEMSFSWSSKAQYKYNEFFNFIESVKKHCGYLKLLENFLATGKKDIFRRMMQSFWQSFGAKTVSSKWNIVNDNDDTMNLAMDNENFAYVKIQGLKRSIYLALLSQAVKTSYGELVVCYSKHWLITCIPSEKEVTEARGGVDIRNCIPLKRSQNWS